MKQLIALLILVSPQVMAETIGDTSGGVFLSDFQEDAPKAAPAKKAAPVRTMAPIAPESTDIAVPPARPKSVRAPEAQPDLGPVPFQASLAIGSTRCPDPVAHPNARNTPVKVFVDQQTQEVRIQSPDFPEDRISKVSTGGGLKIPNGEIKKSPYCARTPKKERLIISAVSPKMFEGTGCTPDEVRAKSTVFPMYHTRTFTDKNGNPIPMPNAVRISGGIFFHQVPPSYAKMLGINVSGECVRLTQKVSKQLMDQINKYGAIEVTISEPPEVSRNMPQYCDENMVADAKRRLESNDISVASSRPAPTGTEDVVGGQESVLSLFNRGDILGGFSRIFNPQGQAPARGQPRS